MNTPAEMVRKQAALVEEGTAECLRSRREPKAPWRPTELDMLVDMSVLLAKLVEAEQRRCWERLFGDEAKFPSQATGHELKRMYEDVLGAMRGLGRCLEAAERTPRHDEFEAAYKAVRHHHELFVKKWPLFTIEEIEEGVASVERGEYVSAEDFFRGLDAYGQTSR